MINFQEMIAKLTAFWAEQGCLVHQGYDLEVGAGTFNPATFLRCLGPEPYAAVYVEPSRRPSDGRYGENPNRVQFYHQMQVIIKPSPDNLQDLYLQSLQAIGLELNKHDIRFVHDDWENPTIGAWGLGWEVWADGMEVTQFTYFQAVGGLPVKPVSGEITYGLERLALYIQNVDSFFDLMWNDKICYGDLFKRSEWEWSHYNFTEADAAMWHRHFEDFEIEAKRLIDHHLPIPAYDFVMKASHAFNLLDARGVISVTERTGYITRIRYLSKLLAESYIQSREKLKFPLLKKAAPKKSIECPPLSTTNWSPDEKEDLLFEIGSEELPAAFVPVGVRGLENSMHRLLSLHGLKFDSLEVFGTPRRIAVLVKGLAGGTADREIERKGPSAQAAFDQNGTLTKAGEGFFRSLGFDADQFLNLTLEKIENKEVSGLEIQQIKGTAYLFANLLQKGESTRKILAAELPKLILQLDFPKKMRWGECDIEYARPLRWIVALYGKEVIPFTIAGLLSSRFSHGHRQLANSPIELEDASAYETTLRNHWVLANIEERRTNILEQLKKIEKQLQGTVVAKERIMPQVLHLVEWPFLTAASFDKRFLKAPKEVLISEMVEHQKYFPIVDKDDQLLPHFLIVCNNKPTDLIQHGNQKALSPRLADGMFLYNEDLKIPLDRFNEKLKSVVFQKELGSVWDKVIRLTNLVELFHRYAPICDLSLAVRAANLCKADLASDLVGEFPELQGTVGKLYALQHGENESVAEAIDEHWMPRGEHAPLPKTACGILLCLSEKIDNLICCFSLELKPTSSSDPYALRRQAIGVLKMILEHQLHLPLQRLLSDAFELFSQSPKLPQTLVKTVVAKQNKLQEEILAFLKNRLRSIFVEGGFEKDEIEAVFSQEIDDVYDLYRKLQALHTFRREAQQAFFALLEIYNRSKKILCSQNPNLIPGWQAHRLKTIISPENRLPHVNPDLFQEPEEKYLFEHLKDLKETFYLKLIDRREPSGRDWKEAFTVLATLQAPLTSLFDKVKIIDEDSTLRINRLSLLQEVWDLCEELIDFGKIQEHESR